MTVERTRAGDRAAALARSLWEEPGVRVPDFTSGTRRLIAPARTLERIRPVARLAGITRVARISGLDRIGIEVFAAYRPASRSVSVAQGKGVTADAARVSAMMEALEMWHAEQHHIPVVVGAQADLAVSRRIVEVPFLLRYASAEPDPHRLTRWTEALELLSGEPVLVPYEAVHFDQRTPEHPADGVFCTGTNGLASGNSVAEAVLHGLFEVVERDAVARAERDGLAATPRLDLAAVHDPACRELLDRFRRAGIGIAVWDLGRFWKVPVFQATGVESDEVPWYHPLPQAWGFGAHRDPAIALSRALTEVAQVRAMVISAARDDMNRAKYASYFAVDDEPPFPEPAAGAPAPVPLGEAGKIHAEGIGDDLRWLLNRLDMAGVREVAVVDLRRPDLGIPVVRVIVPGLWWSF